MTTGINSIDRVLLPFSVEAVRGVMLDVSTYERWWPPDMDLTVLRLTDSRIGSAARVQHLGATFCLRIINYSRARVVVEYYAGPERGIGVWTLEPAGDYRTRLSYMVRLRPAGLLPALVARIIDLERVHAAGMDRLYSGLRHYLAATTR